MGDSTLVSPNSEDSLWISLRERVDVILDERKRKISSTGIEEVVGRREFRDDSLLLLKGFDSVTSSLSQLTNNLDAALQSATELVKHPPLSELMKRQPKKSEDGEEDIQPKVKRQCSYHQTSENTHDDVHQKDIIQGPISNSKGEKMITAKNLAVSMATKAATLARELKSLRSELCFMQDRCGLLEEENRRLRDGFTKCMRPPEEDDLVRLQLEALLAEKSRLANENANLTRENQCLQQLVEYHQLTSQDLSESYEQVIQGILLDFSSPAVAKVYNDKEEAPRTPQSDLFHLTSSFDVHGEE